MKTFYLAVISIFFLSFNACQKEKLNTDLVGTWEWVRTTGGFTGIYQTPQTLGYTYYVVYTKDGKYEQYDQNNHLVSSYPYTITKAISFMDSKEHNMIQINNSMNSSFEIRHDSLFLFQEADDGFNHVFVRKR